MPLGVTSCAAFIYDAFLSDDKMKTFFHGHSYTANPTACSAALASMDLFDLPETMQHVERIKIQHQQFLKKIQTHPSLADARQLVTEWIICIFVRFSKNHIKLKNLQNSLKMKKITLFIYLLLVFSSRSQAQTLTQFWSDTFEDKGAPSSGTRTPENNAGTSPTPFASYFVRTDDKGIYLEKDYSGFQGAKFWAGENHSGAFGIGNEEQQIDFKGIDITGKTGL